MPFGRTEFIRRMHERGIGVGVHYPAIHQLRLYKEQGYAQQSYPNAERIGRETVTLPLFPAMADSDVDRVCASALEILDDAPKRGRS
jgi:dTDP-4-amino-4,6-dideoxygalactose transaminase